MCTNNGYATSKFLVPSFLLCFVIPSMYFRTPHAKCRLLLHVRPNYSHSTSNDIDTDGARARARTKTGGYKGIRGDM